LGRSVFIQRKSEFCIEKLLQKRRHIICWYLQRLPVVYGIELINPEHEVHGKMPHNDSHKHESIFTSVAARKQISDVVVDQH
jgi:anthranilate/para-aminobenzoate synthase component II